MIPVTKESGLTLTGASGEAYATPVTTPAAPANMAVTPTAEKTLTVTWDAVQGATQYNVYRYNSTKAAYVYVGTSYEPSFRMTGLTANVTYSFKVKAVTKEAGLTFVGEFSAAASAKALGKPAAPTNLVAGPSAANEITVTWNAVAGATQYNIYRYNIIIL